MTEENNALYQELVPGARYWSKIVRRGHGLTLQDVTGRANVSVLLYNPHNLVERLNIPDILKAQHTSKLTRGHMLYSDMGRTMMSIVADDLGWHDVLGGFSSDEDVRRQYGEADYQSVRNEFYRSGHELFLIELAKWGLGKRDLMPVVNFFSRVSADEQGRLQYHENHSRPGASLTLRADMDTLVVLNTAPHPMNPATRYSPGEVMLSITQQPQVAEDDYCVNFRPENARAYTNTQIHTL